MKFVIGIEFSLFENIVWKMATFGRGLNVLTVNIVIFVTVTVLNGFVMYHM